MGSIEDEVLAHAPTVKRLKELGLWEDVTKMPRMPTKVEVLAEDATSDAPQSLGLESVPLMWLTGDARSVGVEAERQIGKVLDDLTRNQCLFEHRTDAERTLTTEGYYGPYEVLQGQYLVAADRAAIKLIYSSPETVAEGSCRMMATLFVRKNYQGNLGVGKFKN